MLDGVLMQTIYSGLQDQFTDPKIAKANADKALAAVENAPDMDPEQKKLLKAFLGDLGKFMGNAKPQGLEHSPFAMESKLKKVPVLLEEENKPKSAFEVTFPSSVTWGMYGCIITFAISIVSERTKGTLIRLRMSPLSWAEIVAGKGLACFLVSAFVAALLDVSGPSAVWHSRGKSGRPGAGDRQRGLLLHRTDDGVGGIGQDGKSRLRLGGRRLHATGDDRRRHDSAWPSCPRGCRR